MAQLSPYVDQECPTKPEIPRTAEVAYGDGPGVYWRLPAVRSFARRAFPFLLGGLALGLLPVALVVAFGFLVDYSALGAGWYGAMVFWGCAYTGAFVGVLATYFGLRGK